MKKLTIVIVSYNVRYYLEQCIVSVQRAAKDIDHEICVVDNASADDTVDYLRRRIADSITIIESQHNLGFARANNLAIRQTESEYVLLLNPDTIVADDSLSRVLDFMDSHQQAGGAGAMMLNPNGTRALESRRGRPTPWVALLKMLGFTRRYYMSHLPWDEAGRIDVISGAFCMLRREALDKVGLLDEDFFMYGEDIDLSCRLLGGGYENWYVPATIVHYKGESTQKTSYRYVHVFYQAMLIFFRKHYSHLSLLVAVPIKLAIGFRAMLALVQMQWTRLKKSLGFGEKPAIAPHYHFIGSAAMLDECRQLARRRGLDATFEEATGSITTTNIPATVSDAAPQAIVYDTDTLTFSQIMAHAQAATPAMLGTYSTSSRMLITEAETIDNN